MPDVTIILPSDLPLSPGVNDADEFIQSIAGKLYRCPATLARTYFGGSGGGATTLSVPTLSVVSIDADTLRCTIGAVANETSIQLQVSSDGTTGWADVPGGVLAANTTTFDHNSLPSAATRYYRVRAVGDGVTYLTSAYSSVVNATTGSGSGYDADAEAYFTAAGITDVPTKDFLDEKIVELKTAGVYSKIEAWWLYIGTNADIFKYNVVNPLNTDAAHRATLHGTVTADANGLSSNGTTGYIDFHFNPSTHLTDFNKSGLGYLKRTSDVGGDYANMGVIMGTSRFWHAAPWAGAGWQTEIGNAPPKTAAATANDKRFHAVRSANNVFKAYVDGVAGTPETTTQTASAPNGNVYGMCVNLDGAAYGFAPSTADFVAFWITTDMDDTQVAAFDAVMADMATFFGW
jgi:hypothetical protein